MKVPLASSAATHTTGLLRAAHQSKTQFCWPSMWGSGPTHTHLTTAPDSNPGLFNVLQNILKN